MASSICTKAPVTSILQKIIQIRLRMIDCKEKKKKKLVRKIPKRGIININIIKKTNTGERTNSYLTFDITSVVQAVLTSAISQIKAYIQNKKIVI